MANTPFLDLVKPAGTDRALVSVINSNSDKIDTGVSTLSEQIGTKVFEADTLENTQTAIYNYVAELANGEEKHIQFSITVATDIFRNTPYIGDLRRISRTRFVVSAQQALHSPDFVIGRYRDGTWIWETAAFKSEIVNKENITVLTGTTGNTIGTGTEVMMPSGYTASNTVVIGMQYDDGGTWRVFGMLNASNPCVISTTILSNNKINIIPRDNAGLNRSVKVTVFRYTT